MKKTESDVSPWEKIRLPFGVVNIDLPELIACSRVEKWGSGPAGLRDCLSLLFGTVGSYRSSPTGTDYARKAMFVANSLSGLGGWTKLDTR